MLRPTLLLLVVLTLPAGAAPSERTSLTGEAFDAKGRLRYREYHVRDTATGRTLTIYRDPAGKEIGRMEVDYSRDRFAPAYRKVDVRFDTEQRVTRDGNQFVLFQRLGQKERTKRADLDASRVAVIGPGVDELVRARWDELTAGRVIVCDFAVPTRLQVVPFRITYDERSPLSRARFDVAVDNLFLRLLMPSLRVEYDRETRSLTAYEGPSNVTDDRNRPQHVHVRFPALLPTVAAASTR